MSNPLLEYAEALRTGRGLRGVRALRPQLVRRHPTIIEALEAVMPHHVPVAQKSRNKKPTRPQKQSSALDGIELRLAARMGEDLARKAGVLPRRDSTERRAAAAR